MLAVVIADFVKVNREDDCRALVPPVETSMTCKKPDLRGRMYQKGLRTFAIAGSPRIH